MKDKRLKIAVIVHGRFEAFDFAKALTGHGHHIALFTNYPEWAVKKFGLSIKGVHSFWAHGILAKILEIIKRRFNLNMPEAFMENVFSKWALKGLRKEEWDVIYCYSGIFEDIGKAYKDCKTITVLMRASTHIIEQAQLMHEEEKRTGMNLEKPGNWIIEREKREYELADYIRVVSGFAYNSFIREGINPDKLWLIPLGTPFENFMPKPGVPEKRHARILSKKPLRVLYVGTLSFHKGLWDLGAVVKKLNRGNYEFRFVGPVAKEAGDFIRGISGYIQFVPKQPQDKLSCFYDWADVFLCLSIQDGYPMVLAQAQAGGLPVIASTNTAGPDVIKEGKNGWVVPIRSPERVINILNWCDENREDFAKMAEYSYSENRSISTSWPEAADMFLSAVRRSQKQSRIRGDV